MEFNVAQEREEPTKYTHRKDSGRVIFKKEDFEEVIEVGKRAEEEQDLSQQPESEVKQEEPIKSDVFTTQLFSKLETNHHIQKTLQGLKYTKMTSIEQQAIPKIVESTQDFVIKAPTGSGKSLAVFLPLAIRYFEEKRELKVLVISPTRELSQQSAELLERLLNGSECVVSAISGGSSREKEKAVLRRGCCFLVCTIGRLLDHLEKTDSLRDVFESVETVVIDECDELLEQGYLSQLSGVFSKLREARKIFMSATINQQVLSLVNKQMRDPQLIEADGEHLSGFALPQELQQQYTVVTCKSRLAVLFASISREFSDELQSTNLNNTNPDSVNSDEESSIDLKQLPSLSKAILVFSSSRDGVDFLLETAERLRKALKGFLPEEIYQLHGGMDQEFRTTVFLDFKRTGGVMFATDVAARGLNLNDENSGVSSVIHFDAPASIREYVHRAGRAARAGATGNSLAILMPSEVEFVQIAAKETRKRLQHVPCDMLGQVLGFRMGIRAFEKIQTEIEQFVRDDEEFKRIAERAFLQYLSGYSSREEELRAAFRVGTLHSGHIAKSFGLEDAPTIVAKNRAEHAVQNTRGAGRLLKGSSRRGTKVERGEYDDRVVM